MENEQKIYFYNGENYQHLLVGDFSSMNSIDLFSSLLFFIILAYITNGKVMGWGNKAIEIRNVHTAVLDGVFMHKRAQKLK